MNNVGYWTGDPITETYLPYCGVCEGSHQKTNKLYKRLGVIEDLCL